MADSAAPYDQLHIYEIPGDARPATAGLGDGYLGLWLEAGTSYLFFDRPADDLVAALAAGTGLELLASHQLSYEQWQGGQSLEPLTVGPLTVIPAWQEPPPEAGPQILRLDPGLVFGSGTHPTTRHSLELLLMRAQEKPLGRVLDLGAGTGILGLAAALWGASSVLCVDLNPLCVTTTANNATLNGLPVQSAEGSAEDFLDRPAEVVLSNLHWEVQQRILADPARLAGKDDLILSGIMRSQRGPLEDRLRDLGYAILQRREAENTWFTLWARKP